MISDRPRPTPFRLTDLSGLLGSVPADVDVMGVSLDSRRVRPGDLYAALPGDNTHGARFTAQAAEAGAAAVLTDAVGADVAREQAPDLPVVVVEDSRAVLGAVSAAIYSQPGSELEMIGITGTNGKTTTSFILQAALRSLALTAGIVGTTGVHIGARQLPAVRTTPESPDLHALLGLMVQSGVDTAVLEVSSHALALGRVDGLVFDLAVFTNLTQDHLDFHGTMEAYFAAKAQLFTEKRSRRGIICVDDEAGRRLAREAGVPVVTYAIGHDADWTLTDVRTAGDGSWTGRAQHEDGSWDLSCVLPGAFNRANALGALATLVEGGYDPVAVVEGIATCRGVPGRMETVPAAGLGFRAVVDYAHTPDAVGRAIAAARDLTDGDVIVVLGCGGDRDHGKRPLMGAAAAAAADVVIVTDDNPRSEDPAVIRRAVLTGAEQVPGDSRAQVSEVGDRRRAITAAVGVAAPGDVVLVLGKGHEQGQEIAARIHPFDDRVVAAEAISARTRSVSIAAAAGFREHR